MVKPPALPAQKKHSKIKQAFTFNEYLKGVFNVEAADFVNIKPDEISLVKTNLDFLENVIKKSKRPRFKICSYDYNLLKYIKENIKADKRLVYELLDDFKNIDRSYIDSKYYEGDDFEIPFPYLMWNPKLNNKQLINTYVYDCGNYKHPAYSNNYYDIDLESLKKIREIVYALADKYKDYSDVDKTIIISNYLQDRVQFIDDDNISEAIDGIYKTDSRKYPVDHRTVSSAESVLLNNYGICNGIAHATTLLLNNPEINVNVRGVFSGNHVWNIVNIDGKNYYVDNTWSITRNNNRYDESLKAKKFTSEYLLFGENKALEIEHHIPITYCPKVEEDNIDIDSNVKKLSKVISFDNYRKPIFESKKIK